MAVASAFAAAAACSSSSSDDTGAGDDSGVPETSPSDGPALDDIQQPEDSGNPPPISDDFEDPGQCGDWLGTDAVLTWRPAGAHNSQGACEVCISDAGGTMYRTVVVPAGSYTLDALVEREEAGTGSASWTQSLAFQHIDNSDAGFVQGTGPLTFTFANAETKGSTTDGVRVLVRIGQAGNTDSCLLVDDVKLTPQ
jgi:hypothetical protein